MTSPSPSSPMVKSATSPSLSSLENQSNNSNGNNNNNSSSSSSTSPDLTPSLDSPSPHDPLYNKRKPFTPAPSPALTLSSSFLSSSTSSSPLSSSPSTSTALIPSPVNWRKKLILCLVGLPARGKSYIANKIVGYTRWRGLRSQLFNVGKHRRLHVHSKQDASFFDSNNSDATKQRDQLAMEVLEEMLLWLEKENGDIAVFDATNTTNRRRWEVVTAVYHRSPLIRVIFVESLCDNRKVLESNYMVKAQNSPDYKNMPIEEALRDLKMRVLNYERVYEPIRDDRLSYIKLMNLNSKVIANQIHGQLAHLITSFLLSIHIQQRPIFLSRAGACEGEESYLPTILQLGGHNSTQNNLNNYHNHNQLPLPTLSYSSSLDKRSVTVPHTTSSSSPSSSATLPPAAPLSSSVSSPPSQQVQSTANLTMRGKIYAKRLAQFIEKRCWMYWEQKVKEEKEEEEEKRKEREKEQMEKAEKKKSQERERERESIATANQMATGYVRSGNSFSLDGNAKSSMTAITEEEGRGSISVSVNTKSSPSSAPLSIPGSPGFSFSSNFSATSFSPLNLNCEKDTKESDNTSGTLSSSSSFSSSSTSDSHSSDSASSPLPSSSSFSPSSSKHHESHLPLVIYTSTLPRAIQTVEHLADRALYVESQSSLNMLDTGVCHGLPMNEIKYKLPGELEKWQSNKYCYRWPGGESQRDKARSLEPLVMEVERQTYPVLIISHASTLQVLYGYFLGLSCPIDEYYKLWIPPHHVIELLPHQYGWIERRHDLRPPEEIMETEIRRKSVMSMKEGGKSASPPLSRVNTVGKEGGRRMSVGSSSQVVGNSAINITLPHVDSSSSLSSHSHSPSPTSSSSPSESPFDSLTSSMSSNSSSSSSSPHLPPSDSLHPHSSSSLSPIPSPDSDSVSRHLDRILQESTSSVGEMEMTVEDEEGRSGGVAKHNTQFYNEG